MRRERLLPAEAGSLLDPATGTIGTLVCLIPVLMMFLGLGLMTGMAHLAAKLSERGALPVPEMLGLIAGAAIGLGLAVASACIAFRYPTAAGNVYFRELAARTISRRIAPFVDPRDSESAFVEIVPRAHWGTIMLDTATEVGFLHLDVENRELLFEGNRERWRMPAQAITSCQVEGTEGLPGITDPCHFAVIRTRGEEWALEIPITPRGSWGGRFISKGRRREVAAELCRHIQALLKQDSPQAKS